jgi:hypothetical protein
MHRALRSTLFGISMVGGATPAWAGPEDPAQPEAAEGLGLHDIVPAPELVAAIETATEAELEPELEPAEGPLPTHHDALAPVEVAPEPREAPPDGRGMLTAGSLVLAGGLALFTYGMVVVGRGEPSEAWNLPVGFGVIATATGGLFVGLGARRFARYRRWEATQTDAIPRRGSALTAAGAVTVVAGAGMALSGAIGWAVGSIALPAEGATASNLPPVLFGVGLGTLALGTSLLVIGKRHLRRFDAWRLSPSLVLSPHGGSVGVAGRF